MVQFGPLVSPQWLSSALGEDGLRVVDVRWYLDGRPGRDAYLRGHIPGAVFADLDADLSSDRGPGRHPLPSRTRFQAAMRRLGVSRGTRVVAYDDSGGSIAARLWWLLGVFGPVPAAILDGGLQGWKGDLANDWVQVPPGDFTAREPDHSRFVDFDDVERLSNGAVLLDARAPERYRGEVALVDPVAGHIPGAINACWQANLGPDGRFLAPMELRQRFLSMGVREGVSAVVYCGSGVTSCHDLLALELAGLPGARLYPGSWSDWSSRPGAPVELSGPAADPTRGAVPDG